MHILHASQLHKPATLLRAQSCARAEYYYRRFFRDRGRWHRGLTAAARALEDGGYYI